MLATTRSLRAASKGQVALRAPVSVARPSTAVRASKQEPDLAALKEAALGAAQKGFDALKKVDVDAVKAQAADALKNVDVGKLKDQATGGIEAIKKSLDATLEFWGTYDKNGDGKLTIDEAVALLNSKEVSDVVTKLTGLPHTQRTAADIKKWFNRADFDQSGDLSKREFAVMYTGLLCDKAKVGAKGLAQAVCGALDKDGDGQITSDEFKALLQNSPLAAVASVIPDGKVVNYRELLGKL